MNISKSYDFFKPELVKERIHIIGCGSVGSTIAENLARCGITNMSLYDFDIVEPHNVNNQMFRNSDVGKLKVVALSELLAEINPDITDKLELVKDGWKGKMLSGYIFLAVDNIEIRRKFVEQHKSNPYVKAVFDVRTGLTFAQHYAADWSNCEQVNALLDSMQFSHEEVAEETPVSACGVTLGVVTTVRLISALCVNNFIKFAKKEGIWKFVQIDGFTGIMDCFS